MGNGLMGHLRMRRSRPGHPTTTRDLSTVRAVRRRVAHGQTEPAPRTSPAPGGGARRADRPPRAADAVPCREQAWSGSILPAPGNAAASRLTLLAPVVAGARGRYGSSASGVRRRACSPAATRLALLPRGVRRRTSPGSRPDVRQVLPRCRAAPRRGPPRSRWTRWSSTSGHYTVVVRGETPPVVLGPGAGEEPSDPTKWARWAGTIEHEIVTGIGPRTSTAATSRRTTDGDRDPRDPRDQRGRARRERGLAGTRTGARLRVAVIGGGRSCEHDVSLATADVDQ